MESKVEYWLDLSRYDIDTADAMLVSGRYLYVAFMCHQSAEKALKAVFARQLNTIPPKTHNLELLADKTNLIVDMPKEVFDTLKMLEPLNIECRYPKDREQLSASLNASVCKDILMKTKELLKWIESKLNE